MMRKRKNGRGALTCFMEQLIFCFKDSFKEKGEEKLWPLKDLIIMNSFLYQEISCVLLIYAGNEPYKFFSTWRERTRSQFKSEQ